MNSAEDLISYYGGNGVDDRGRSLSEVQGWPDDSLERVHDYIQWMFPLREHSAFNRSAPILDDKAIAQFRSSKRLKSNLRTSFRRMLTFYGFEMSSSRGSEIVPSPFFSERRREWISHGNHNYLRITRILKSLCMLGLEEEARTFFKCLSNVYKSQDKHSPPISVETFEFWKAAASGDDGQ